MIETYEGGCHCGRVRFRVRADLSAILECNCSICTKKAILHLIVPPEQFELLSGDDALTTYQFNTKTARHTFCSHCGMHPFYTPRSHPDHIDVNARCLDGVDVAALRPRVVDGRDWEATWGIVRPSKLVNGGHSRRSCDGGELRGRLPLQPGAVSGAG